MEFPLAEFKNWFLENKRAFPWRINPTPYRVWVSEVMLQQTIASVVVPYFEKWMERFPTIEKLACAKREEVIKMWEGLGYYSRARNLHEGARFVMEHFDGVLPSDEKLLASIPGIGPYTMGAILSFAFHQRHPAIDANVMRVMARYLGVQEEISTKEAQNRIRQFVDHILPQHEPWIISEALIELGATLCKKTPQCVRCPLISNCFAYRHGLQEELPKKKKKEKTTSLFRLVILISFQGKYLVKKEEVGKVMGDLYEFPYIEIKKKPSSQQEVIAYVEKQFPIPLAYERILKEETHTFTRFKAHLFPYCFKTHLSIDGIWKSKDELLSLPFSSGHRRILNSL